MNKERIIVIVPSEHDRCNSVGDINWESFCRWFSDLLTREGLNCRSTGYVGHDAPYTYRVVSAALRDVDDLVR